LVRGDDDGEVEVEKKGEDVRRFVSSRSKSSDRVLMRTLLVFSAPLLQSQGAIGAVEISTIGGEGSRERARARARRKKEGSQIEREGHRRRDKGRKEKKD
jgi:hypothetical protein